MAAGHKVRSHPRSHRGPRCYLQGPRRPYEPVRIQADAKGCGQEANHHGRRTAIQGRYHQREYDTMGLSRRDKALLLKLRRSPKAGHNKRRSVIGFIPARGGSRGIKGKNLKVIGGYPLVGYTILVLKAAGIDNVWVSTDDPDIADTSLRYGAKVIKRPSCISRSISPSEDAIKHFLRQVKGDIVVMSQCTSPLLQASSVALGLQRFHDYGFDSLFSACIQTDMLLWNSELKPINYDPENRGIRQRRSATSVTESGGFYIFSRKIFKRFGCRIGGRVGISPIPYWQSFQVDDKVDLAMIKKMVKGSHNA